MVVIDKYEYIIMDFYKELKTKTYIFQKSENDAVVVTYRIFQAEMKYATP